MLYSIRNKDVSKTSSGPVMPNLTQLTEQIGQRYGHVRTVAYLTQKVAMKESGTLRAAAGEYILAPEALAQFARTSGISATAFLAIDPDLRAQHFNRRLQEKRSKGEFPGEISLTLDGHDRVLGFDKPGLLKIDACYLIQIVTSSLPRGLQPDEVQVSRIHCSPTILSISCFSPQRLVEPQVGDIVNGGVDVHHSITGEFGTQIRCYLRRLICENGATTHVCSNSSSSSKRVRSRRLFATAFVQDDMVSQIRRLLVEAWDQLDEKLNTVPKLLKRPNISSEFLDRQRTRFSLNNNIITAIGNAADDDELASTGSQFDSFNAISRVATHNQSLSLRQCRTLMHMAGELSQHHVHRCDQCGSWITQQRAR